MTALDEAKRQDELARNLVVSLEQMRLLVGEPGKAGGSESVTVRVIVRNLAMLAGLVSWLVSREVARTVDTCARESKADLRPGLERARAEVQKLADFAGQMRADAEQRRNEEAVATWTDRRAMHLNAIDAINGAIRKEGGA